MLTGKKENAVTEQGFQMIRYAKEDGMATITLNRPEVMNAFNETMLREWISAVDDAKQDPAVRVVVLTGAGRGFCSGADTRGLEQRVATPPPLAQRWVATRPSGGGSIQRALMELNKPLIGAINGAAVGGGMDVASMCDLRIASDQARFAMSFVRLGRLPGAGGCWLLPRIVGLPKALELIWSGETFDAQEALRIGYVSKVVPHDQLMEATKDFVAYLAHGPAIAQQLAKRLVYRGLNTDLPTALQDATWAVMVAETTEDVKEATAARREKREPRFQGR